MNRTTVPILLGLVVACASETASKANDWTARPRPALRQPDIADDGSKIAFVHGGDIYVVPSTGGLAERVVSDPATETSPRFSPSGTQLAFTSGRSGGGDIYVVDLATGRQRRLTFHSGLDAAEGWDPSGRLVYFSTSRGDISGYSDIYAVPAAGGTPFPVSRSRYEGEYNTAVSPDGQEIAFNVNDRTRQWWRMGPRTDDSTDIWIKSSDPGDIAARRLTHYPGKDSWPMWTATGKGIYFVSDRGNETGADNIFFVDLSGSEPRQLTSFAEGRILWPSLGADDVIVFERDFQIWLKGRDGEPGPIQIELPPRSSDSAERKTISTISELAISENSRRAALIIFGDVFVKDLDNGTLRRVTDTPSPEKSVAISPDGQHLAFATMRHGFFDIALYDLRSDSQEMLTDDEESEHSLRFSPDGRWLAFAAGSDQLKIASLGDGQIRQISSASMLAPMFAWSPDSRKIAFMSADENWFSNVSLQSLLDDDTPAVRLTNFPDVYFSGLSFVEGGPRLYVSTWTDRENRQLARISAPENGNTAGAQWEVDSLLRNNEELALVSVSPNGKWALLSGTSVDRTGLWIGELGEPGLGPLRFVSVRGAAAATILDSGEVFTLSRGRLHRIGPGGNETESYDVSAEFVRDAGETRRLLFRQAWLVFLDYFADETFNGKGWANLYAKYAPYAAGARNNDELLLVAQMMIGELNASHLNIPFGSRWPAEQVGELGVDFDPVELAEGRFVVTDTLVDSPLRPGVEIISLDGEPLGRRTNLQQLLLGHRHGTARLRVRNGGAESWAEVPLQATGTVSELRYQRWVNQNRELVSRLSGGRFEYIHLRHVGRGATEDLRRRLGASALPKDGIIIDIRNNGGGVESTKLLSFLMRQPTVMARHQDKIHAPSALIHGVSLIGKPMALLQNEQVLSNAEIFSHHFRASGAGPVIGTRTAGWVKGTRRYALFDGTIVSVGAFDSLGAGDGDVLDRSGRQPDIFVERDLSESLRGVDSQIEVAVKALSGNN